ncbi:unnamed protein product [Adineta steineri]|uniref:Secreted protein n=1 Tax=Adineta steineri TaxID=433720 RepID=A0A813MMU3_9BILA|nr:unnamed protein product [Adineta steineri]CAF0906167.1 unnamed protein product [Adineta steineri]CAF0912103.1 unnamed protein product [Adineta steineri]CAF0996088.1 unnamed protein product [Adineta steineri]CAF1319362.1 unnamed protein product [Adineta steineri]
MHHLYSRSLIIWILCLLIIFEEASSSRLRAPGIRVSASFQKPTPCHKKKAHADNNSRVTVPNESMASHVRVTAKGCKA